MLRTFLPQNATFVTLLLIAQADNVFSFKECIDFISCRQRLVDCIQESGCDRVLVTHGTDTMIETARYLAATIHDKTVVLCGSLRPEAFRTSDADFNVGCAVGALGVLPAGVFVVMSGRAFAHDAVSRDPQTGRFVAK